MYQIVMSADLNRSPNHAQQYELTHEAQPDQPTARSFDPPDGEGKRIRNLGDS